MATRRPRASARARATSSGAGDLEVRRLAGHERHRLAEPLHQLALVGGRGGGRARRLEGAPQERRRGSPAASGRARAPAGRASRPRRSAVRPPLHRVGGAEGRQRRPVARGRLGHRPGQRRASRRAAPRRGPAPPRTPARASRPFRTESARAAPPGHRADRACPARPAPPAPRASSPGRDDRHELVDQVAGGERRAPRGAARVSPPRTTHCLATPARCPDPPAATIAPDPLAPDHRCLPPGAGTARAGSPRLWRCPCARPPCHRPARPETRPPRGPWAARRTSRGRPERRRRAADRRHQVMLKIFLRSVSTSCSSQSLAMASSLMSSDRAVSSILRSPKERSLSERSR